MLLQVHDELVLECPQAEREKTPLWRADVMESAYRMTIPLTTEAAGA